MKNWRQLHLSRWEKKLYGTYIHNRFQIWLELMIIQTKIISSTTQHYRPFQEEEEIVPQRLDLCVPVLLIRETQ